MSIRNTPDVPQGMEILGTWIDRTFKIWTAHWRFWFAVGGIYIVLQMGIGMLLAFLLGIQPFSPLEEWADRQSTLYIPIMMGILVVLRALIEPGMIVIALAQLRGEPFAFADLTRAIPRWFLPALGLSAISFVLHLAGFFLCLVGLVYAAVMLFLALPILIDQRAGIIESLRRSSLTTSKNFWLFLLYGGFFWLIGLGTGVFIAPVWLEQNIVHLVWTLFAGAVVIPWVLMAYTVAYEEVFNVPDEGEGEPAAQDGGEV